MPEWRGDFGPLVHAIALMGAFMMGAHDAQVHMANQVRRAGAVKASLPADWQVN